MEHLVYLDHKAKELEKIIEKTKTKIIRGATGRKLPYGRVFEDEILYFVENDGSQLIKAKAYVKSVFNSEPLTPEASTNLILSEQPDLNLTDAQLKRWSGKKRLCIVEIKGFEMLDQPIPYYRQKNMDDWITVAHINEILEDQDYQSLRIK
ncbi:hypothetical protein BK011_02745 [Tenericutes bacterium MZ-XQ]|jgi:hypothetical protein|nr:hypothetical protein BK011_02745 [Tenericutes bacterium MZ-XQ]